MFLSSYLGNIKGSKRWIPLLLLVMIVLKYVTVGITSLRMIAAVHPVIALLMFWGSIATIKTK
jgi:hypothetical protein